MKEVLSVSVNGKFHQYLMLSEVRFINQMVRDIGPVTIELVSITNKLYKSVFGK